MGYDRCPYLSFFYRRFEKEKDDFDVFVFWIDGRRDLNTEYTIFWPTKPKMLWYDDMYVMLVNVWKCKIMRIIWRGKRQVYWGTWMMTTQTIKSCEQTETVKSCKRTEAIKSCEQTEAVKSCKRTEAIKSCEQTKAVKSCKRTGKKTESDKVL
jgi:hypothetical protein